MTWRDLYDISQSTGTVLAGYYNRNIRVTTGDDVFVVRIPIPSAEVMDLRIWQEPDVLRAVSPHVESMPRILHESVDPPFQVHTFMEGQVLDSLAPRGKRVPPHVLDDVTKLFVELGDIREHDLPALPVGWPTGDDTAGFGERLARLTLELWELNNGPYREPYGELGFPDSPLADVMAGWPSLTPRRLVCVHADVHRKNILVHHNGACFLDWELALWGDPLYDLAVHLHKMSYQPDEQSLLIDRWVARMPPACSAGWAADLDIYLAHEQIKSAIVDTVRSCLAFADPSYSPDPEEQVVQKLVTKLNNAHHRWGTSIAVDEATVRAVLTEWAEGKKQHRT